YGPYVQLGEADADGPKPKRVSLGRGYPLESVTLEVALQYLSLPRKVGAHPETQKSIRTAIGRFGPSVVCDAEFRSLPSVDSVFNITLDEALALLAMPKRSGAQKKLIRNVGNHPASGAVIALFEGRYGPYVTDG